MSRLLVFVFAATLLTSLPAYSQVGSPGINYPTSVAAGEGGQLYPYDQQDPWIHGHFQRMPAYGGFNSFRPYNYRHVYSQTQISTAWGAAHGMPYSQQFWNRYRGSYLDGNLHSSAEPLMNSGAPLTSPGLPLSTVGYQTQLPQSGSVQAPPLTIQQPTTAPVHIYPSGPSSR